MSRTTVALQKHCLNPGLSVMAAKPRDPYAQQTTSTVLSGLGQHLLTLSERNKQALLSEAAQLTYSADSKARAAAILSRLQQLNPDVAGQFHLKQDALSDLNLRMICSSPASSTQSAIDLIPAFIAVSYCWHYPQWPLAPAATPVSPGWEISQSMMDAIMALRQAPDEGVWLDKLCINQSDLADKTAHIASMDLIYRSARRIVILLEDIQLDKAEEEAGLAYAGFYADLCREIKDAGLEGVAKGRFLDEYFPRREKELREDNQGQVLESVKTFAMKILGARWLSRAWCAHESRMTKHQKINNPIFLCFGFDGRVLSFEFRFIHYLGLYLCKSEPQDTLLDAEALGNTNDPNPKTLHQRWWRIQRLMPDMGNTDSAMQHLVSILSFGCLLKRDLISIALNTAGIPLYFDGEDIQSVEDAIWKFSLLVLASGDLVPFISSGSKLRVLNGRTESISWAVKPDQAVLDDKLPNPLSSSITTITRDFIELDLLVFESTPKQASPESQANATHLIEEHNLNNLADELFAALNDNTRSTIHQVISARKRIKPNSDVLQVSLHRYLSLALDNGLGWILDFPWVMQQTTSDTWLHGTIGYISEPRLAPAACALLILFNKFPSSSQMDGDRSDEDLVDLMTRSLTALLDPRLLLFTTEPRLLRLSRALGTAALTDATSNRAYIAVPAALAHLPGYYNRAWVLEPFDPAAPPEEVGDFLPPRDLRLAKEGEEMDAKIEDIIPVLNSDYEDRRAKRDDGRATWRLRRRQVLFGCPGRVWGEEGSEMLERGGGELDGGEGVVLLRRQRVYGAEDYPWGEIHQAMMRVIAGVSERVETRNVGAVEVEGHA
ncbi:hypothetical protein VTI74DRAFT_9725 [Chaetomium olivicolor]